MQLPLNLPTDEAEILAEILTELKAARKKHPHWPVHMVARAAIVSEEAGELLRAALNHKYEAPDQYEKQAWQSEMKKEAIQTAATCIRFILSLQKHE